MIDSLQVDNFIFPKKLYIICLVGSVIFNGCPHAMVLDTMKNGKFIFKNTRSNNKKFEIEVNHNDAPDEFFFVHIQLDFDRLNQIRQRMAS